MSLASELFGAVADAYARHRLTYPEPFFDTFVARLPRGAASRVWDCGCGSGQASLALAERVSEVIATDASAEQLRAARPHPRLRYHQATAAASGLEGGSIDAVMVAAAIHWFAGEDFDREVRRVCRPGAVLAWIGYLPMQAGPPDLRRLLHHFHEERLAPWWPHERRWVEASYAGLRFPGLEWPFPGDLWIERRWSLDELLGHLSTWSAVQRAREAGDDPLPALRRDLERTWPRQAPRVELRWPFMGRWGEVL